MSGYDQWKTASPYDDEPDWLEEGEKWMTRNQDATATNPDTAPPAEAEVHDAYWIIEGLLEYIAENT